MNSLIYRALFYVNIYGSYKLSKNSPVFWPTLYIAIYRLLCNGAVNDNNNLYT